LIWLKISFLFLWNYGVAYSHILRASSCASEWRAGPIVIFRFDVDITSSWWRPWTMRGARSSWSQSPLNLVLSHFTPWWFYCKSTPLLVMSLKPFVKVVTRLKTPPSSHGLQFLALDTIVGCAVRFADCLLIARHTT
jgi:hypothetical protein